jgi:glycosyltransferase involved in cell wall biosynthesis
MLLVPRQPVAAARCLWDDAGPATASSLFLVAAAVGIAVLASAVHMAGAVHVVVVLIVCPPVYLFALRTLFRESWDDLIRLARRMLPTALARRMPGPAPANPAIDTGGPEIITDSPAGPTVSVVVAAYNSQQWIVETITAILGQTRRPDEVIVVDDGSTDGTVALLSTFGEQIRVVTRRNGGCPAAFNTAFAAATCDFVAMCGSDDVWKPHKLERQIAMLAEHPEIDVAFSDAELFGLASGTYAKPPGTGILDSAKLARALYVENIICAPSIVIRRSLFEQLGPFIEDFGADDLEYWLRCLRAGAVFAFDPEVLLGYRRHESNLSSRLLWMQQCTHEVHRMYAEDMGQPGFVSLMLSSDLFKIGRSLVDEGRIAEARASFRACSRHRLHARALAWSALLTLPPTAQETLADSLIGARRRLRKVGFSRTAS